MLMLDTNICIFVIKQKPIQVLQALLKHDPDEIVISSITACELAFGISKSPSHKNKEALTQFLSAIYVLPFDETVIWHYGELRHYLQAKGTPIGSLDMLIAAHALSINATLVTNNTKEFSRLPNLKLVDWV